MKKLILNTLFLFSVSASAFAQTNYYVNDGTTGEGGAICTAVGNDANNGTDPSTPKATIEDVINDYDLGNGDIINVDIGTFNESFIRLETDDEDFVVQGQGNTKTIFDGNDDGWFFMEFDDNNDDIIFNDLKITDYLYTNNGNGAGLRIIGICSGIELNNVIFDDVDCINGSNNYGGVIVWGSSSEGSDITITNSAFLNCDGGQDGAIFVDRGIADNITISKK